VLCTIVPDHWVPIKLIVNRPEAGWVQIRRRGPRWARPPLLKGQFTGARGDDECLANERDYD
jgi:hypothetical protein